LPKKRKKATLMPGWRRPGAERAWGGVRGPCGTNCKKVSVHEILFVLSKGPRGPAETVRFLKRIEKVKSRVLRVSRRGRSGRAIWGVY